MATRDARFERMLAEMRPLFWDTQTEALDSVRNAHYIISRLLNMGGMRGYIWVTELFSQDQIVDVICHRRDLRRVVRSFMAQRYHIPQEQLIRTDTWR